MYTIAQQPTRITNHCGSHDSFRLAVSCRCVMQAWPYVSLECKYRRAVINVGVPMCHVHDVLLRTRLVGRGTCLASDTPLPPHVRKRSLVQRKC